MRQKATKDQFAERRALGLALLARGKTPKEVAEILEVTRRSVDRWLREIKHSKKQSARSPGRPRKLSDKQVKRLGKALDVGLDRIGDLAVV